MSYYWLSFCDSELPKGGQFLGVCIVSSNSPENAVVKCHNLSINPGGEVMIVPVEEDLEHMIKPESVNLLLTKEDLIRLEYVGGDNNDET